MERTGLMSESGTEIKNGDYLVYYSDEGQPPTPDDAQLYRIIYHPEYAKFMLEKLINTEQLIFGIEPDCEIGVDFTTPLISFVEGRILEGFQIVGNMRTHRLTGGADKYSVQIERTALPNNVLKDQQTA
jgi:hypothetical protein